MTPRFCESLALKTTLGIGGPASVFVLAENDADVVAATSYAREHSAPLRVIGAGSNLLVPDEGIDAVVVRLLGGSISFETVRDGSVLVTAGAGVAWDALVDAAVERGLYGVENLAGVPGTVGGAAVQNIGAYGAVLSDVFAYAEVYNTLTGAIERIERAHAAFGYRASIFKRRRECIILRVALRLSDSGRLTLAYPDLVRFQAERGQLETPAQAIQAIRSIRAEKFPNLLEEGTAGSFFANPVISERAAQELAARFPGLPLFPLPESPGRMKVPLAWILEHVLHLKGFALGTARLYEKHALVVVVSRGANARAVDTLAAEVAQRVRAATGIVVEREVETFTA